MKNLVSNIKSGKMDFMVFMPLEELGENPQGTILFSILFSIFELNKNSALSGFEERSLYHFPKTVEFIQPGAEGAPTVNRNEIGVRIKFDDGKLPSSLLEQVFDYFHGVVAQGVLFETLLFDKIEEEAWRKEYLELYKNSLEVDLFDVLDRYLFLELYNEKGIKKILKRDFSHRCEHYYNTTTTLLRKGKFKKAQRCMLKIKKRQQGLSDLIFDEIIYSIVAYVNNCYGVPLEIETECGCGCSEGCCEHN